MSTSRSSITLSEASHDAKVKSKGLSWDGPRLNAADHDGAHHNSFFSEVGSHVGEGDGSEVESISSVSRASSRLAAGDSSLFSGLSGWAPVAYKSVFEGPTKAILQDPVVLDGVGSTMVDQLNSMLAFMTQVLNRERANQSANLGIMIRRVDKDLKETYQTVKETFANLTKQLLDLVKEVEDSRKRMKSIEEKYTKARMAADAQGQYVIELEAVLEGQSSGSTETIRKLNSKVVQLQKDLATKAEESKVEDEKNKAEIRRLKAELKKCKWTEHLIEGDVLPPLLPEMPVSWTLQSLGGSEGAAGGRASLESLAEEDEEEDDCPSRKSSRRMNSDHRASTAPAAASSRSGRSGGGGGGGGGGRGGEGSMGGASASDHDMVGALLAHCDAERSVPRSKLVRTPQITSKSSLSSASNFGGSASSRRRSAREVSDLQRRLERAERRCSRLYGLVCFASSCLTLQRDVLGALRSHRLLRSWETHSSQQRGGGGGITCSGSSKLDSISMSTMSPRSNASAEEVLASIVKMFHKHIPSLTSLPEVLKALKREVEEGPPKTDGFLEDTSITTTSISSCR